MKGKVIINNQEIEIEINEEQLEQLKIKKKTGYERVESGCTYIHLNGYGDVIYELDHSDRFDLHLYQQANYYSDSTVAHNNARADKLMRELRRFAVENRKKELDWNGENAHFYIMYNHRPYNGKTIGLQVLPNFLHHHFGIYFDTKETAQAAIEKFKVELIWYFTEYKDSL